MTSSGRVKKAESRLGFHHGKTLMRLAQVYPSLHEAALESVQNAIDANATWVKIVMDRVKRNVRIYDNGDGADQEKFDLALLSVSDTLKKGDKLGQFGLGLISPLGKCAYSTFTSSKDGQNYLEWTFNSVNIAAQRDNVTIPRLPQKYRYYQSGELPKGLPGGVKAVAWKTRVEICGYSEDRKISEIKSADSLKEAIIEKYGVAMRRNDVSVHIRIQNEDGTVDEAAGRAKRFSGRKLPDVTISDKAAGNTIFRMYLAKKTKFGYRGQVLIGIAGNDFRFSFATFAKDVTDLLPKEVLELFKSGIFEGEIISSKGKLHESRKKFEQNDALVGFCAAIENWYEGHGKQYMKEAKEERQDQRLQNLSLQNLATIKEMFGNPEFARFRKDTIETFAHGTVGGGNAGVPEYRVGKTQDRPSATTRLVAGAEDAEPGDSHSNDEPKEQTPGHTPFTAVGPAGERRTQVRGSAQGLQFHHVSMRPEGPLFKLDATTGTIFFNVEHPDWVKASGAGDRELMQLQELGAIMALARHTIPEEYLRAVDLVFDELISPLSFLVRQSAAFNLSARIKSSKAST